MADGTDNAKLQRFLFRNAAQPTGLGIVGERTAQGVANLVGEGSNARHLGDIGLHTQQFVRIGTRTCTPALAIDEDGGVDVVNHLANLVHGFDIVNAHQVEAETIDMVFVDPVFHRLQHEATHHGLLRGSLVATAGAVAIARRRTVGNGGCLAVVVVGIGALEVGVVNVVGVIVNHVENDTDPSLVEGLDHLLELTDAYVRTIGVRRIATLGHVVVDWVVAPVVFVVSETRLVHRTIVVRGQDMDGVNSQRLQVVDSPRFGQRQELTRVLSIRASDGKVAMVHLVDDEVSW